MKRWRLFPIIIAYIVLVLAFAVLNWLHFEKEPTSFLISEQLNRRIERYEFKSPENGLAIYLKSKKDSIPLTIEEFELTIKPLFDELDMVFDSLALQKNKCAKDSVLLDSLSQVASVMRSDSISVITQKEMGPYQRKIANIERSMEGRDSIELALEGTFVELAEAKVEFAVKNAQLQSAILDQYAFLVPSSLYEEVTESQNSFIQSLINLRHLEDSRRVVYDRIRAVSASFHNNRINTVRFWDFLYYSVCVSTSVSFGDMAPNDSCTRTMALIELLLCVGIIGYIVGCLAPERKRISKKKSKKSKKKKDGNLDRDSQQDPPVPSQE